jgi:hypothetical protein
VKQNVSFPAMRREVMSALASLSDRDYQERAWLRHEYPPPIEYDDFDQVIHTLYDDMQALPEPERRVGSVLLPGDEIDYLRQLGLVLDRLIDRHGNSPDSAYLTDPDWDEVIALACRALAAMIRGGGYL